MLDPRAWDQVADRVSANDLYRPDHRHIYKAIVEVVDLGQPPDAVTVGEHLSKQGRLEEAGRNAYLARMVANSAGAANVQAYAKIVRDRSMLRQLIEAARDIASSAYEPEGREVVDLVDEAERGVFDIADRGQRTGIGFEPVNELIGASLDRLQELSDHRNELKDAPLFIDDAPALKPTEVRARARRLKREHDLGLFVVDYLQLMQAEGTNENRTTEISRISQSLKSLARELNIPVVALSQLNRGVEQRTDKRPMMSDLRESGAIEQDADEIIFIYREDFYDKETPKKGLAEIIIRKQRNGDTGTVNLIFKGEYTRFENYVRAELWEGVYT